jgi:hypothetical protein
MSSISPIGLQSVLPALHIAPDVPAFVAGFV